MSLGRISIENAWSYWEGCWFSKAWGTYKILHAVRTQWKIAENPKAIESYLSSSLCILTWYTRHSNEMETWQRHAYTGCFGCDHYMTVCMLISHSHRQQTYCGQFIRDWGFWLLRFFPFLVWMVFFLQWDLWLNDEFASWILHKKENLENVHSEVQLWILKKMSSIKFMCIEAYQKSGRPLVQFVAQGDNPRDMC